MFKDYARMTTSMAKNSAIEMFEIHSKGQNCTILVFYCLLQNLCICIRNGTNVYFEKQAKYFVLFKRRLFFIR